MLPLDYQPPERRARWTDFPIPIVTCGVGLIGNIILVLATWKVFWFIPAGTIIDPMGFSGLVFMVAAGTAVIGVPLGILGVIGGRERPSHWVVAILGIFLSLTPMFTSGAILDVIVAWHGLVFSSH